MKQNTLFILLLFIFFTACEKDDFCVQNPVTSKLIITFYDDTNRETSKLVRNFSIFTEVNTDTIKSYNNVSADSIAIPLNPDALETTFNFSKDGVVNQLHVKYDITEEYVSRSCGYKLIFSNLEFSTPSKTWFVDFTPTTVLNLDDQTKAHVQIFH